MNMVQYDLQFATVSVPAEVSHEEIRSTVANVVTDAGTKAKNTTTTTAKGVIDSIGVIALIVCVFMLLFGKKSKALEIIVCCCCVSGYNKCTGSLGLGNIVCKIEREWSL